jgi:hypothetical protein
MTEGVRSAVVQQVVLPVPITLAVVAQVIQVSVGWVVMLVVISQEAAAVDISAVVVVGAAVEQDKVAAAAALRISTPLW